MYFIEIRTTLVSSYGQLRRFEWAELGHSSAAIGLPPSVVVALAESPARARSWTIGGGTASSRSSPSRAMPVPRSDRALDLCLAERAHMGMDCLHERNGGRTFDARHEWPLVMRVTRSQFDHGTVDERADALNHIPIGHRYAHHRLTACGRWAREKRALAFEDADEPIEICVVDSMRVASPPRRVKGKRSRARSRGGYGASNPD
ncbi:MAG TPA: hypothetical protein VGR85_15230 [Candidatus Limnocylindria bacterium]|nr:hypothetical protein [Candidatus Limnocylindria bacterium]